MADVVLLLEWNCLILLCFWPCLPTPHKSMLLQLLFLSFFLFGFTCCTTSFSNPSRSAVATQWEQTAAYKPMQLYLKLFFFFWDCNYMVFVFSSSNKKRFTIVIFAPKNWIFRYCAWWIKQLNAFDSISLTWRTVGIKSGSWIESVSMANGTSFVVARIVMSFLLSMLNWFISLNSLTYDSWPSRGMLYQSSMLTARYSAWSAKGNSLLWSHNAFSISKDWWSTTLFQILCTKHDNRTSSFLL